jgi:hypothetical protein
VGRGYFSKLKEACPERLVPSPSRQIEGMDGLSRANGERSRARSEATSRGRVEPESRGSGDAFQYIEVNQLQRRPKRTIQIMWMIPSLICRGKPPHLDRRALNLAARKTGTLRQERRENSRCGGKAITEPKRRVSDAERHRASERSERVEAESRRSRTRVEPEAEGRVRPIEC